MLTWCHYNPIELSPIRDLPNRLHSYLSKSDAHVAHLWGNLRTSDHIKSKLGVLLGCTFLLTVCRVHHHSWETVSCPVDLSAIFNGLPFSICRDTMSDKLSVII